MGENASYPLGGIDYPRTLQEFDECFSSEDDCIRYLQKLRWANGFKCPVCKGGKAWMMSRGGNYHMDYYLDEYTFRFNRRKSKTRGMLFYRLLQQAVEVTPVPYNKIIQKKNALPEG